MALRQEVIDKDRALEKASSMSAAALMEHRWHWTLDASNPEAETVSEYARQVGLKQQTVYRDVKGFEAWRNSAGAVTPDEARERVGMQADTQAVVEAVAKAHGIQFGQARRHRVNEVKHVRDQARERAERRGTSVAEEVPFVMEIEAKARAAEAERRERRRSRYSMRYIEFEAKGLAAQKAIIAMIRAAEDIDGFPPEERSLMEDTLRNVQRVLTVANRAILDRYDESWKQELKVIEGGLAAS